MKVYMTPLAGADASSAPHQANLVAPAQIGDLVLSVTALSVTFNGVTVASNMTDVTSSFASVVTENSDIPDAPVLIQNSGVLGNQHMIALMQRGTTVPFSGSIDIDLQT